MPQIWSLVNASIVSLKRSAVFTGVIPSKMFESLAMRKPLILAVEGESANLLKMAEAGITVEPENAAQMAEAIGRAFVERFFDRRVLAARYLEVLENTLEEKPKAELLREASR